MGFYDEEKTARQYIAMAEGYDGSDLISVLQGHLAEGSSVLELGMGPGKDLDLLGGHFEVTGSDTSQFFLDLYRQSHPNSDLLQLDAVTMDTDRRFDCIYSNKVLHHLTDDQLAASLVRQSQVLAVGGYVMHAFWHGSGQDDHHGLKSIYRTERDLEAIFETSFDIVEMHLYQEMDVDDSVYVLARLTDTRY